MGWSGIMPSIGVKFDTYQNDLASGDLAGDHIALIRDGRLANGTLSPLIELGFNLEDGQFHNVTFDWNSVNQSISVHINGALTLTKSFIDLKSFVGDKNYAFPGFTSSTGASTNRHMVCIKSIQGEFFETRSPSASSLSPAMPGSLAPTRVQSLSAMVTVSPTNVQSSLSPVGSESPTPSAPLSPVGTAAPVKFQSISPAGTNAPAKPPSAPLSPIEQGAAGASPAGANTDEAVTSFDTISSRAASPLRSQLFIGAMTLGLYLIVVL